ncbi:hypothetical protein [Polymorphospora sp. NPDC050346]|uniref:hypothetical protein n=1 Tax=Polymorphospora sp. NPDC050346 TaxID=3155780 RepID=UPI0033C9D793
MDAHNAAPAPVARREQYPPAPPAYVTFYRENYARMMRIVMHAGATWHEADELTNQTLILQRHFACLRW